LEMLEMLELSISREIKQNDLLLMKLPKASPPSFVPKSVEIESVFEIGRRNCLRASLYSGHAAMMCCTV